MALKSSETGAESSPPGLALATDIITPEGEMQLISLRKALKFHGTSTSPFGSM